MVNIADYSALKVVFQKNSSSNLEKYYVPFDGFVETFQKTPVSFEKLRKNVARLSAQWKMGPNHHWETNHIGFFLDGKRITGKISGNESMGDSRALASKLIAWESKGWDIIGVNQMTTRQFNDFWGVGSFKMNLNEY